ncbi:hypothetical protein [Henriciella litoralis]|uniref:hypothetical protein n=1 Tax=Henriciella litoralis TaxID=568102 RepID=UPI0009FDC123|nr:hypothetical protein [Henriciella litoralis]
MTKENMTDDRLFVLIEAYGAEPGAWPEDERAAAERLLASDPSRFASALEDARALDLVIEQDAFVEPPAGLAERLLADAPAAPQQRGGILQSLAGLIMPNGIRWPAGAALASLVMGLFVGYTTAAASPVYDYQTEAEEVIYGALGYDAFETYMDDEVVG